MKENFVERKKVEIRIEVIAGSMFSGKTDELIRRVRREEIAHLNVQVFKPSIEIRYKVNGVNSHSGAKHDSEIVDKDDPKSIIKLIKPETRVVAIDEGQFFGPEIVDVCEELVTTGKRVIVAGLPTDFRGEPFGSMPLLMARAEVVDRLAAVCMVCGEDAYFTQRIVDGKPARYDDPIVIVGAAEMYEARCRIHHEVPGRPENKL